MEHQSDSELHELLSEWKTPDAPASLERRVLGSRPWWHVLVYGYIRVPVPVACSLVLVLIGGAWRVATLPAAGCPVAAASPALERPHSGPDASKAPAAPCALKSAC